MNNKKLKMQDAECIIKNNNRGTLSMCVGGKPYSETISYDYDCFCGCIKIYFEVCKCGRTIDSIRANNNVSLLISNNCGNCTDSVLIEGTAEVLPNEVDCCCREEDRCMLRIEMDPTSVTGHRLCSCNRRR